MNASIHPKAFVHPHAVVEGDVTIKAYASIWPTAVLRGDMGRIEIGEKTSIQDGTICHMTLGESHTIVGDRVTVGHRVILHGCVIENDCLIGMGSILLDNCRIGSGSFIAAGSLITGRTQIPPRSFVAGSPAKVLRSVNDKDLAMIERGYKSYVELIEKYRRKPS